MALQHPVLKTKSTNEFTIAFMTDPHFGNRRTPALGVLAGIRHAFPDAPETGELDIIIIGGDFFDRLLYLNDQSVFYALMAIRHLVYICERWNVICHIVEGTNMHDRHQSEWFNHMLEILDSSANVRYLDDLTIVHVESLDINILYLPDEYRPHAADTLAIVKRTIASAGLEVVDVAVVHGGFVGQLPVTLPSLHDPVEWSKLVRYRVFSGHIHKRWEHLMIDCAGSFTRNTHGEEEPKGWLKVRCNRERVISKQFIENPYARIYKTIDIEGLSIEEIQDLFTEHAEYPTGSAIRLAYGPGDPIAPIREVLELTYPNYVFSEIRRQEKKTLRKTNPFLANVFKPVPIGVTNIKDIMLERLTAKGVASDSLLIAGEIIDEVK